MQPDLLRVFCGYECKNEIRLFGYGRNFLGVPGRYCDRCHLRTQPPVCGPADEKRGVCGHDIVFPLFPGGSHIGSMARLAEGELQDHMAPGKAPADSRAAVLIEQPDPLRGIPLYPLRGGDYDSLPVSCPGGTDNDVPESVSYMAGLGVHHRDIRRSAFPVQD